MNIQNDNRMHWIRNLEKLNKSAEGAYCYEYEVASECHIAGVLDYEEGKIYCCFLTTEPDRNGLYKYQLKVMFPKNDDPCYNKNANKNGYCFQDGVIGELLSLFSLYFQCRFYVLAEYLEIPGNKTKIKTERDIYYRRCNPSIHPKIFNKGKRNFAIGLADFMNSVKRLEEKQHQDIILACYHYARSLKEVGIDSEMVFIRLVSSIEVLLKYVNLSKKDNPLDGESFEKKFKCSLLNEEELKQLKKILNVNRKGDIKIWKIGDKFKYFIKKYSKGYFKGGNWKVKRLKIRKRDLSKILGTIYASRSKYLHSGEPMYISNMRIVEKWDTDPSLGKIMDNRYYSESEKLPYPYWFEDIVRHCLLNYLKENIRVE